ncbi:MAG: acetylornithine/succinyldiaminopimelate transaminase [Ruminobacter sp.]|uniref:acetylornithine/succinyldiaminopimelate transaminase n=1 Tax=unclassified Ruminobacter TaxID=2627913 RepID=UPI0004E1AFB4|nr:MULTISPECIES: acetylornithine/succinyldiaminopimelate transaminase [unclassified Ruminobacter]MBQ3776227.1 acetylornithine/succinyldiaminopimelate transaminase [Ruminobacter sp.]
MSKVTRADFDKYLMGVYCPAPFVAVKGSGSRFWDDAGKEYVDFGGGIAVNVVGHCHPEIVSALEEQAHKLWHISNYMCTEPAITLAKHLVESTFADKVFFANSGGEANEAALKLARRYAFEKFGKEKSQIISFYNSFHGRTLFDVTVGGQAKYCEGFGPLPGDIIHADFNDLEQLKSLISKEKTCAVIMEPIQGEGGILPATEEFIKGVRQLCDENDALLIFDEVQTGFGRTGCLYAYQHYQVEPDILTSAKGLGAGIAIGAMMAKDKVASIFKPGLHGTTFGSNPLATSVGCKSFELVNRPEFLKDVNVKADLFRKHYAELNAKYDCFKEVRGIGLMIGAELKDETLLKKITSECLNQGVFVLTAGHSVIRTVPALNITTDDINEGFARFDKALSVVFGK